MHLLESPKSSVTQAMSDQSKALPVANTELVVSVCMEDLSWLDSAAKEYKHVTVYDKCHDLRQANLQPFEAANLIVQRLENVGSCDFAFLNYILDRWDSLPDIVEFTKGSIPTIPTTNYTGHRLAPLQCMPCDGKCDTSRTDNVLFSGVPEIWKPIPILEWNPYFEYLVKTSNSYGLQMGFHEEKYQFKNQNKKVRMEYYKSGYANMGDWMSHASKVSPLSQRVYEDACCARTYGGHFTATRKQIVNEAYFQGQSRKLYAWLRDQQHYSNEEVDHFIERTWWSVFCAAHHSK